MPGVRGRYLLAGTWCALAASGLYFYLSQKQAIQGGLEHAFAFSLAIASVIYLVLWGVRPFTLIPSTFLVLVALPFFPPALLFGLTLIGVLVSSSIIYLFSKALGLRETFEHGRHAAQVARVRGALERHEMPILIGWSFFPLTPTDVICYVAGAMEINFPKFLLGIALGKGTICAVYIFGGDSVLRVLLLKP